MTSCLSGISIGLADAIGRSFGVPVHDLLGGRSADRLPVYASTGYMTKDPENQLEAQLARVAAGGGFIGAKIKIGASPSSDAERVRIARGILGDDALLLVDMNGNYTPDLALESMRRIERFGIHWVEEPLPPTDVRGYAELRARAPIPIAAGEALYTVQDFKRLVDARGLDILQPSVPMCGGLQQAKAVALLAAMNNIRFSPHVWGGAVGLAAALHLVASVPPSPHTDNIPCPMLIEYDMGDNPLRDRLLKEPIRLEDGHLILPQGPGLGIEVDSEVVAEFRLS
jgi:D-galactarolactone cycloisomerase